MHEILVAGAVFAGFSNVPIVKSVAKRQVIAAEGGPASLISAVPGNGESLWRRQRNIVKLTFEANITVPESGQLSIRQMLPGGVFGSDISAGFQFSVVNDENGNPRVLRILDVDAPDLVHRNWYALQNAGGWGGAAIFMVQYVVQEGDANNDGLVLNSDASLISAGVPCPFCTDDRRDISGDDRILGGDVALARNNVPSFRVPVPLGH